MFFLDREKNFKSDLEKKAFIIWSKLLKKLIKPITNHFKQRGILTFLWVFNSEEDI